MSRKEDAYLTCLPTSRLWEAYSLEDRLLTEVKLHLIKTGWLSEQGKWCDFDGETVDRERFTIWDEDDGENNSLVFFFASLRCGAGVPSTKWTHDPC